MKKLLLGLVLIVTGAGVAGGWPTCARSGRTVATGLEQFVEIPPGASSFAIGERLVAGGVVAICRPTGSRWPERPGTAAEGR